MTTTQRHKYAFIVLAIGMIIVSRAGFAKQIDIDADPRIIAAQKVVERMADGGDAAPSAAPKGFDPLRGTRDVLRILKSMESLAAEDRPTRPTKSSVAIRSKADVRRKPDSGTKRFAVASVGAKGRLILAQDDWLKLSFDNGTAGWVRQADTDYHVGRGDGANFRLLRLALASRGTPYVWGGKNADGVDCSGLILRLAKRFGLHLPHSAALQWKRGVPVGRDSLLPGDLVFFANTYKPGISHVGVYAGDEKFVHASSGRGKVTVSSLKEPYYTRKYAGARRLRI